MHETGCLICGKDLHYFNPAKILKCNLCGKSFETNASCIDEHFVCDVCHSQSGLLSITSVSLTSDEKNPITIATKMMRDKSINMHGPEHHYLIVAALLTAYKNSGGDIDLNNALITARQRAKNVPGGICGMWGSCGAGIGTGIFVSIITGATPLSEISWSQANLATSMSLATISQNGGPRCCKRNTWISIATIIDHIKNITGVHMDKQENIICSFFPKNPSCKKEKCIYFPMKNTR